MAESALADVVVLELATGVAGPYCGRLLADLGAQVIKVEPPGGDPVRLEGPLVSGESAFFAWLNGGKRGLALALDDTRIEELAAHADVIIHSARGPEGDTLDARLAKAAPTAVVVSLTPYGRSGPRSEWQATPLTEYATGGYHYFAGDPAREPLALPGHQVEYHAGLHAGVAALVGLWHSRSTGAGQHVEISHQEAMLSDHAWLTTSWNYAGQVQRRTGSAFVKCADGYFYIFNLAAYPNLLLLMERFDLFEDPAFSQPLTWAQRFPEVLEALGQWAATKTKQEVYHACQELRIAASPVNTMEDVANSAQLAAREWFAEVEAGGARFKAPGFPYRLTGTPCEQSGPAPTLGQHTAEVLTAGFQWANANVTRAYTVPGDVANGPLSGLRVIELTANWAGPAAGRDFADLGADVVKIELATKPATRAIVYPGADLWPEHFNRAGYFNKHNRNKRSFCLDLSQPAGKTLFLKLVGMSDVVIENNAARVMANLGVPYETLAEVTPGLVMVSMSGYGATGPERDYSAYGSNIETICGLASLLGYGPGEYFGTGSFYADPITGNHGAVAALAALHARRRDGRGQWVDMSLLEAAAPFFAQQFLEYSVTGQNPEPNANRSSVFYPHDVYKTAGTDCWLAVAVRDEADWRALATVIGRDDLAALSTVEARRERAGEIDDAIAAWATKRDHLHAAEALQAAGVPAAPVMPNWEIASDNHLHDRGFFVPIRHPHAGTHLYPGFPWRFARTPAAIRRPAPMFAEHNDQVFAGLLGLSAAEVAALHADGVTSDHPIYAAGPSL